MASRTAGCSPAVNSAPSAEPWARRCSPPACPATRNPHRSQLSPPDRGRHRAPDRQHRLERRGQREPRRQDLGGRLRGAATVAARASNWRATGTPRRRTGTPGVVGSPASTPARWCAPAHPRPMKAGVFSGLTLATEDELLDRCAGRSHAGRRSAGQVSTGMPGIWWNPKGHIGSPSPRWTSGIKTNTPRNFAERGIRSHVLPSSATFAQIADLEAGRGVPVQRANSDPRRPTRWSRSPVRCWVPDPAVRICFGNQILGRRAGPVHHKMTFGHRGINIPVIDRHRRSRSPRRTTASPSRGGRRRVDTVRPGGGQPHLRQ